MTTDTTSYRRVLVATLRMRGVPGDRIGDIVAEVESHVAETGESPVEAFGPPGDYAVTVAPGRRASRALQWALMLSGAAVGWLVAISVLALVRGSGVAGFPAWLALGLAVGLWIPAVVATMRSNARVRDPRTGEWLTGSPGWVAVGMGGLLIVIGVAVWLVAAATA
jgi:uncharacterized membrane protein YhdT